MDKSLIFGLLWLASTMLFLLLYNRLEASARKERDKLFYDWMTDRKDLLDRIQAPSFQEYTSKVIREKKLENQEEPEKPIQFVS